MVFWLCDDECHFMFPSISSRLFHFYILETPENKYHTSNHVRVDLCGLVVSVLATGPKVRGFDPDRGRWIFKGDKKGK
jgi:hypothetical protein